MNTVMIYKSRLKELREEKDIRQLELTKILNIDNSLFAKYEKEYYLIPIKHLNTLCNYFNCSLDYIFGFKDVFQYENSKEKIDLALSGNRIKELRKERKITQSKLGEILGCSYGTIAGYERGRYPIATPFLYQICQKYNRSADYLLGKIDEPKYLD